MTFHEDGLASLLGDCIRQAVRDYLDGFTKNGIPDAGEFLESCGLLDENGLLDSRLKHPRRVTRVRQRSAQGALQRRRAPKGSG